MTYHIQIMRLYDANNRTNRKGRRPITKNIRVIDEQGNEYEATYAKRANGLVKNGRARFIDEKTLCLACPPNNLEDNNMTDTIKENFTNGLNALTEGNGPRPPQSPEMPEAPNMPKMPEMPKAPQAPESQDLQRYILEKIDAITGETMHIMQAFHVLQKGIETVDVSSSNETIALFESASNIVSKREETNTALITLLRKMLEDSAPRGSRFSRTSGDKPFIPPIEYWEEMNTEERKPFLQKWANW